MKVHQVSVNNNYYSQSYPQKTAFGQYTDILRNGLNAQIKNDRQVEELFTNLFKAVCEEKNVYVNPEFKPVKSLYERSGFRGFLNELWKANQEENIAQILQKKEQDYVRLVLKYGQPIFELFNFGRYGFSESATSPHNVKVLFNSQNQREIIEFGLSKKGNLLFGRTLGDKFMNTEFYNSTGTRMVETTSNKGLNPEKVFYNEDGSKSFFKNWLFGGTIPPAY